MYEILQPVSANLEQFISTLPTHALGKIISVHTQKTFPELNNVQLALITVNENRGSLNGETEVYFDELRKNFYQLFSW